MSYRSHYNVDENDGAEANSNFRGRVEFRRTVTEVVTTEVTEYNIVGGRNYEPIQQNSTARRAFPSQNFNRFNRVSPYSVQHSGVTPQAGIRSITQRIHPTPIARPQGFKAHVSRITLTPYNFTHTTRPRPDQQQLQIENSSPIVPLIRPSNSAVAFVPMRSAAVSNQFPTAAINNRFQPGRRMFSTPYSTPVNEPRESNI